MRRYVPFIIVGAVAAIAFGGGAMLYRAKRAAMSSSAQSGATARTMKPEHVRGEINAPVALEEFGDFQCPACATVAGMLRPIEQEYGSKLRVVFWNFPLAMHKHGRDAALAAEAASLQRQFWQMYDLLYEKQSVWSTADDVRPLFEQFATQLQLDVERFKKDYGSVEVAARVDRQRTYGVSRGVKNTPTIFINGREVPPPFNPERLREAIDAAAMPAAKS
jgi:protein-disulfide isomerase